MLNWKGKISFLIACSVFSVAPFFGFEKTAGQACLAEDGDATRDGAFSVPGWFSRDQSDIVAYPMQFTTAPAQAPSQAQPMVVLNRFSPYGAGSTQTTKSFYYSVPAGPNAQALIGVPGRSTPFGASGGIPFGGPVFSNAYMGYGGLGGPGAVSGLFGNPGLRGYGALGAGVFPGAVGSGYSRGYAYGNPFMQRSGFSFSAPFGAFSRMSTQVLIDNSSSGSAGNYYAPASGSRSASGGYYSSSSPSLTPTIQMTPKPYQPSGNYWGGGGNPFPKDLNKTPW